MNNFNKILCFFFTIIISVPLLCFDVSADDSISSDYEFTAVNPSYYGIENFEIKEDGSGFKIAEEDLSSSGVPLYFSNNVIDKELTDSELHTQYGQVVSDKQFILPPYALYNNDTWIINAQDCYTMFTRNLNVLKSANSFEYNTEDEYYYFTYYFNYSTPDSYSKESGDYIYDDSTHGLCYTYISTTPFKFVADNTGYYLNGSEKYGVYCNWISESGTYNDESFKSCLFSSGTTYSFSESDLYFDLNLVPLVVSSFEENYDTEFLGCYTNCNIDVSMFDNTDCLNYGMSDLQDVALSTQIDVKLTPQFGVNMDRTFDTLTGQNDYFKFEVTNNSNTAIQFTAAIVDEGFMTTRNQWNTVSSFAFDNSYWNYIHEATYYNMDSKEVYEYLVFGTQTTFYMNLEKGNIYWVYLAPGEHFEDYIYWENVKITPFTVYDFLVEAIPCKADYAVASFYMGEEALENSFYMTGGDHHWYTFSEGVNVDPTVELYCVSTLYYEEIFRQTFSVTSIPNFSSTIKGGNSKITTGWNDTEAQASNPYSVYNLMDGVDEPVSNWSEYKLSNDKVDVSLDDVSISDIPEYIDYSQSFFGYLKAVFDQFPALWTLIVFGLVGIIAIAFIRYIRG